MTSLTIRTGLVVAGSALWLGGAARPLAAAGGERINALAGGAHTIFALRGNTVVTFDESGRELARCARFESLPFERSARAHATNVDAEEALRLAGLPDDDMDSVEAEDMLADEGLAPARRTRPVPAEAIVARAVAASPTADDVWIATSAGLFRGRAGGCTRVALAHRDTVAVAAAGDAVAVATADLLWRADGDGPFRIAAGVTARPRALAIVDDRHTLVATDDAVLEIGPYGVARTVLDHGSDALAVCGGVALALASDGAWTWTGDAPPQRAGDRPPARTLICGDGPRARFVAAGDAVFVSADGAVWRERAAAPGRAVSAVAAAGGRIWAAAGDDLIPLGESAARAAGSPGGLAAPTRAVAAPPSRPLPALPTQRLTGPSLPWPQLTVVFAGQRTPLRDGWSLVVLVGFHLGRGPASGGDRRQLAAELLRRDAELAAQELELAAPAGNDPSRDARLRALRQEREALR